MIPSGWLKREMSKLLTHDNALLQRAGLLYLLALLQRVQKAHLLGSNVSHMGIPAHADGQGLGPEAGQGLGQGQKHTAGLNKAIANALHRCLPDFQLFLNLRLKYTKVLMDPPPTPTTTPMAAAVISGDQDVAVDSTTATVTSGTTKGKGGAAKGKGGATTGGGGATEGGGGASGGGGGASGASGGGAATTFAAEKARYLLGLVLRIVEIYVKIAPELVAQTGDTPSHDTPFRNTPSHDHTSNIFNSTANTSLHQALLPP